MANHFSHAALPFVVKGARYTLPIPWLDADGDPLNPTTPTTEITKDGGAYVATTETPTIITGSNGSGYVTLTGAETDASLIMVAAKAVSGPKNTLLADRVRVLPKLRSGTAQAGAAGSITLDSGASAVDDYFNGCIVKTTGGTGGGGAGGVNNQARVITDYAGGTKVATVEPNWEVTPDVTTTFDVLLTEMSLLAYADVQAWRGTQPNALQSARVDAYLGAGAAGVVDATLIATDAIGSAEFAQAAADKVWLSAARTLTSLGASLVQEIWDRLTSALTTAGSIGKLLVDNIDATISSRLATAGYTAPDNTTITTINNKIGAFAGSGLNTILGFLRALGRKDAALTPSDMAGTYDNTTDALEALKDGVLTTIQADTDDLQTRIPTALVGGRMDSNVSAINNNTGGIAGLDRSSRVIGLGTVGAAATVTSIPTSSLTPAAIEADQFKGRTIEFDKDTTTTALRGQGTDITASSATGTLTVTALTRAPVSGDTFVIL